VQANHVDALALLVRDDVSIVGSEHAFFLRDPCIGSYPANVSTPAGLQSTTMQVMLSSSLLLHILRHLSKMFSAAVLQACSYKGWMICVGQTISGLCHPPQNSECIGKTLPLRQSNTLIL
jgi:hypothetical protein